MRDFCGNRVHLAEIDDLKAKILNCIVAWDISMVKSSAVGIKL